MGEPLLSVCLITYNHVKYIREAIEGVLMQKVNFTWELIIADDFSTDGTKEIVLEYKGKYPDFIKLILQKKNVGPAQNFIDLLTGPKSKYIAYFEGDDYWIDSYKLQKQVDILEQNKNYSFCFHNAYIYYVDKDIYQEFNPNLKTKRYKTRDLLIKHWFIPTASLLIRNEMLPNPFPEWFYNVYHGDYALELLVSTKGDFFCINEKMCVYRKNAINSMIINGPQGCESLKNHLSLLKNFKKNSAFKNAFFCNFAALKARFTYFRGNIYNTFPFIATLKDVILHGKRIFR